MNIKKQMCSTIITAGISGAAIGSVIGNKIFNSKKHKIRDEMTEYGDKYFLMFSMLNEWLRLKQSGRDIKIFFEENGYKKIAIYGIGPVGMRLYDELLGSSVVVNYAIDRNNAIEYKNLEIRTPDEPLPDVDAIVVTAVYYFDEVYELLHKKSKAPILNLEDIIFEL